MRPEKFTIKLEKVMGLPLDECMQCGKPCTNRHHVIPLCLKPKWNITIPLCDEHKDMLHPIVRTFYFPKSLRQKIGKLAKLSGNMDSCLDSIRKELRFHENKELQSSVLPGALGEMDILAGAIDKVSEDK